MTGPARKTTEKPRLLVTGASGLLGHAVCALARRQWSIGAVFRRNRPQVEGVQALQVDLTDENALADLLRALRPQAVIHAAAAAQVAMCQTHPQATEAINVQVPALLARLCADAGISLLFTSTDLVFDGTGAPYDEDRRPTPFCIYSDQKSRAEDLVLRHHPQALVCRLPLLFGLAPYAQNNFTVQMLAAIDSRRPLSLFLDEFRTPVDNVSAARGILKVLGQTQGVLHLGGRSRVSRHALGVIIAKAMHIAPTMIRAACIADAGQSLRRAPDCSLNSQRAYALGYNPTPLAIAVRRVVREYLK